MRDMFSAIAPRYDFITRAFSFGMDRGWKRLAVTKAGLPPLARILDLACGTADFGKLALESSPGAQIVAADLTHSMLQLAQIRDAVCADAALLPFRPSSFDAVFVGYGLRNFPQLDLALQEIQRVLKPGGMVVTLDFFLPPNALWRSIYLAYLYAQGTFWGILLHGRARIYTYIPDSLANFLSAEAFASRLQPQFSNIAVRPFLLGGIAVHWARKL